MVLLVALAQALEDRDRFLGAGRINRDGLETAFQGAILLNVLAVFVKGGGADALQLAAGQGRLEDVGGVQAAFGTAGTHDGVDLVDEGDDVVVLLEFSHQRLEAFLKLAAVLGAGHQGRHVQRDHALVFQKLWDLALDDLEGEALYHGGLAHARFADQERVVFLAARQNLNDALDFLVAADDGVELSALGKLGEIAAEVIQEGRLALLLGKRWV